MPANWPLVARDGELRELARVVRDRAARGAVLSGPAGVGKTRLLRAALEEARGAGLVTPHWVQASEAAAALPFGAVAHLVPEVSDGAAGSVGILHAARAALVQASARPPLLAVDDAHLLDAASAALIAYTVASGAATVLLTLRVGDAMPDAIEGMFDAEQLLRLELGRLTADAVGELLARALGGQVDTAAVRQLFLLSDGNPLLLRELVRDTVRRGSLREQEGLWQLTGRAVSRRRLDELVGSRLAELGDEARAVGATLALGEPLEAALLETLTDSAARREIERAGLVQAVPDGDGRRQYVRLVHPLYSEAVRARAGPTQARALYRALADALQATGARRRGDTLRVATWRLESGQAGEPDAFCAASRRAVAAFDYPLAERLARAALQAGAGFAAKLALSVALRLQGRAAEAEAVLADWKREAATDAERVQAALNLADNLAVGTWHPERVETLLTDASALVKDPHARRHLLASRADSELFQQWRVRDALQTAEPLVAAADVDPLDSMLAAYVAVAAGTLAGHGASAITTAESVRAALVQSEDMTSLFYDNALAAWTAVAHVFAGRLEQAGRLAADRHRAALDQGMPGLQAMWALTYGQSALFAGQVTTADRWLREAVALTRSHLQWLGGLPLTWSIGCLIEASALRGDLAAAEAALADAHSDGALPASVPVAQRLRGPVWLLAARGELSAARDLALAAAQAQRDAGAHAFEALALHDAVRLGATAGALKRVADRLHALTEIVDGELVPALAAHARALLERHPGALAIASAEFERLGFLLHAAEAAAQLAERHRDSGRHSSAHAAAARARQLADRCEGARTPALAHADEPLPLTAREREIATLAAQGLTNKQIAERLVISVRTADNHLHRAYIKLGITSRHQLREILTP